MSQPFYQPARQNFSSSQSMQQPQGGFGGFGGGYQMPQQNWGGGFGGGFQPSFGGGFGGFGGGFQQQQFNPYQGGFGGGFSPYQGGFQPQQQQFNPFQGGYGGMPQQGFNPMFGGIGGLGFNPMMGPQFGMPMQGMDDPRSFAKQPSTQEEWAYATRNAVDSPFVNGRYNPMMGPQFGMPMQGFNPYQQQQQFNPYQQQQQYGQQPQSPQTPVDSGMNRGVDNMSIGPGFGSRQPMYGGIGGLGFNPMMGPQFGMPMGFSPYQQQFQPQQDVARRQDQMPRMADLTSPLSEQQWRSNIEERKALGAMGNWGTYQDYVRNFKTPEQTQDAIRQRQALTM